METTKTRKKASSGSVPEKIIKAYKDYILNHGSQPASVYKFCVDLGITEEEFYNHFGSFEGIEKYIWKQFIDITIKQLQGDKQFASFSAHEKILAFYYALIEILKTNRSLAIYYLNKTSKLEVTPSYIKDFRKTFEEFIAGIMKDGLQAGEIPSRPVLENRYPQLFWLQFSLTLSFWRNDESAGFEKTDAYIEKSIRLAFELVGKGVIDSAIDFAKFVYQSKWKSS